MNPRHSVLRGVPSTAAVLFGLGLASASGRPAVVGVAARSSCITQTVRVSGFVVARDERGASIDAPGYRVSEILVAEGDKVIQNQDLLRAVRLGGTDAAPQGTAPTLTLHAPVAGVVTRVTAVVGALTGDAAGAGGNGGPSSQAQPQVRIDAGGGIDLLVDVPSLYATKIAIGALAKILKLDGREDTGAVRVPVGEIDPTSQLGQARVAVASASTLRPGQFASAWIETVHECHVSVPRTAIMTTNGVASVQVVNGATLVTREVRMGLADGSDVQILDGLAAGETVNATASSTVEASDQIGPVKQTP